MIPEKKDYMLIREIPDIFISADVHHNGFKQYKGTILLNGGCWQKQTEYQLKQGHVPTPCIVPQLSLDSLKLTEHHFTQGEA
jgi:DNA polymerase II small subunit